MKFETMQEKVCYGLGRKLASEFASQKFQGFSEEAIIAGFSDGLEGKPLRLSPDELNSAFDEFNRFMEKQRTEDLARARKEGQEYLEANRAKPGVTVTASGLQYEVIRQGDGDVPGPKDVVRVKYRGTFVSGEEFDSNDKGIEFPVNGVIAGWTEALKLMKVGSIWRLAIPSDLAYGSKGVSGIPPESVLLFEVELLDIVMKARE